MVEVEWDCALQLTSKYHCLTAFILEDQTFLLSLYCFFRGSLKRNDQDLALLY